MDPRSAFGIGLAVGVSIIAITFVVLSPITSSLPQVQSSSNSNSPIPVIHGYYKGADVFFIHTEASDNDVAKRLSDMASYPVIYVPDLAKATQSTLAKVYVFKNGIKGTGVYGGGPFGFQDDVFDSFPGDKLYNALRMVQLVAWKDNATPRILKSVEEIRHAEMLGELIVEPTDVIVNMPMIKSLGK